MADVLLRRHSLYLNGLVLISPALNQMTFRNDGGNDLPYVLVLPAFTATAWYITSNSSPPSRGGASRR